MATNDCNANKKEALKELARKQFGEEGARLVEEAWSEARKRAARTGIPLDGTPLVRKPVSQPAKIDLSVVQDAQSKGKAAVTGGDTRQGTIARETPEGERLPIVRQQHIREDHQGWYGGSDPVAMATANYLNLATKAAEKYGGKRTTREAVAKAAESLTPEQVQRFAQKGHRLTTPEIVALQNYATELAKEATEKRNAASGKLLNSQEVLESAAADMRLAEVKAIITGQTSEAARIMRFSQMVTEVLRAASSMPTDKWGKQMQRVKAKYGAEVAQKLVDAVNALGENPSPDDVARAVRDTLKPSWMDKFLYRYRANLLSNALKGVTIDMTSTGWLQASGEIERTAQGKRAVMGVQEAAGVWKAAFLAATKDARAVWGSGVPEDVANALDMDLTRLDTTRDREYLAKLFGRGKVQAVVDGLRRGEAAITNSIFDIRSSTNAFQRSLSTMIDLQHRATLQARADVKAGIVPADRMTEAMQNYLQDPEFRAESEEYGRKFTLSQGVDEMFSNATSLGRYGNYMMGKVQDLRRGPGVLLVPFFNSLAQLSKFAADYTPPKALADMSVTAGLQIKEQVAARREGRAANWEQWGKTPQEAWGHLAARLTVGTALSLWAMEKAKRGEMTMGYEIDKEKREEIRKQGLSKYAVKFGDKWYDWRAFGNLAGPLAFGYAVNHLQTLKEKGQTNKAERAMQAGLMYLTFNADLVNTQSLLAMAEFISGDDETGSPQWYRRVNRLFAGMASGTIPGVALMRATAASEDTKGRAPELFNDFVKMNIPSMFQEMGMPADWTRSSVPDAPWSNRSAGMKAFVPSMIGPVPVPGAAQEPAPVSEAEMTAFKKRQQQARREREGLPAPPPPRRRRLGRGY